MRLGATHDQKHPLGSTYYAHCLHQSGNFVTALQQCKSQGDKNEVQPLLPPSETVAPVVSTCNL